jgi:hypothetical protein
MDRVLLGTTATLTQKFYSDLELINATGNVVVTIYDTGGTQLVSGNASSDSTGIYDYQFTPTVLDSCTVKWVGTFDGVSQTLWSTVEVVGARYFPLAKMRERPALQNTDKFPLDALESARQWAEIRAEDIMQKSYVPRAVKETFRVSSVLPYMKLRSPLRTIRSVQVAAVDTTYTLAGTKNVPFLTDLVQEKDIDVVYEYGADQPDGVVSDAVFLLAVAYAQSPYAAIPSRAERWQPDGASGMYQLAMASADRTGIPEVDAVLQSRRGATIA